MSSTWIVTGANRGLGLEFARRLHERGDTVIATARQPGDAGELAQLGVRVEALDVADAGSVASFAERVGDACVDVLLNNAGVYGIRQQLPDVDEGTMRSCFETNALGALRVTTALLPALRRGEGKLIAHMTSKMGSIADNGSGGSYAYRASKAALNAIHGSLTQDLAPEGFRCAVLHPGWVRTDMGGSGAPLSIEDSVEGLLRVLDGLDGASSGGFFDYSGAHVPW